MLAYLQIFADQEEELNLLDDAARGRFLSALLAYATRGEVPELTGDERLLWPSFRRAIDQAAAKLEAQSVNGNKGGRPKTQAKPNETQQNPTKPNTNPTKPNETQHKPNKTQAKPNETQQNHYQEQEHIQEQEQEQEQYVEVNNVRTRTRFTPPTPMAVAEYALTAGLTLDPQRFCDFYASKGWKVGKDSMTDWKAAVRNWCARDKAQQTNQPAAPPQPRPVKTVREQQYNQREYNDEPGLPAWIRQRLEEEQT